MVTHSFLPPSFCTYNERSNIQLSAFQIFRDGSPTEYDGPREAAGIVSFLKKQGGPAVSTLADAATVTKFRTLGDEKDVVGETLPPDNGVTGWLLLDNAVGRLDFYSPPSRVDK